MSESSRTERFLVGGICLLLFWAPIPLGSNRDWSASLLCIFISLFVFIWSADKLLHKRRFHRALRRTWFTVLLLFLVQLWVGLQLLLGWTVDPEQTVFYLMLGLSYTFLFVLILDVFNSRKRINFLLATLVVSGTIQAFYGSLMVLSGIEWGVLAEKEYFQKFATGTYVNRNHLAGYLEITLACGIALMMALPASAGSGWAKLIDFIQGPKARIRIALVIMVIGLVMTRSRLGNAAFFTSLLICGSFFVVFMREHRLRNSLILISLLVIDVFVVSQYFGLNKLQKRIESTYQNTQIRIDGFEVVSEQRDEVFQHAWPMLNDYWLKGSGAGSFEAAFPQYAGADIYGHFDHAHNDILQFFIELGLLGAALLVLFVLVAMYKVIVAIVTGKSFYARGIGVGMMIGVGSLLIHSLGDFNLQIPANAASFMVLFAVIFSAKYAVKVKR